jgi:hypothetical protein
MKTDFNCKLFDINVFNRLSESFDSDCNIFSEQINDDLMILDKLGFHRLICIVNHSEFDSVALTLSKIKSLEQFIKKSISLSNRRKFKIFVYPKLVLGADVPYIMDLCKLALNRSKYIFLELPAYTTKISDLDEALNKILYNCKLVPVFSNFQVCNNLYPDDFINRLIKIKGAAFEFSLRNENFERNIATIRKIYNTGNLVLFSTNCDHKNLNQKVVSDNLNKLKKELDEQIYLDIIIKSHVFLR